MRLQAQSFEEAYRRLKDILIYKPSVFGSGGD